MKTIIAIDSFKGSLSSLEAGNAVKVGVAKAWPEMETVVCPLADGGEGTVEALLSGMGGEPVTIKITGPMGEKTDCTYGFIKAENTAIIETAASAGISLVPKESRNPLYASSYGLGENIKDAVLRGIRKFIIGLGGSVTNDCGMGMLEALGFKFFDDSGSLLKGNGLNLSLVRKIDDSDVIQSLSECTFEIACDVNNPLCGENGASFVFGFQKGANIETVKILDFGCRNFSERVFEKYGKANAEIPGAGAAGGLGYCFSTFFNSKMRSGIDIVIEKTRLEQKIKTADYVVTGEGRIDFQTAMGKAPAGITSLAQKYGACVIGIAGSVADGAVKCNESGMAAFFSVLPGPLTLEEAMDKKTATKNIENTSEQIFRLIKAAKRI